MNDYFEVMTIAENVYQIYEPGGVGSALVIGGEKALLIDTGYGFADIREVVESITDLPLTVVNTHGHADHAGGNRYFDRVWMNPADEGTYRDYQVNQKPLMAARFETVQKAKKKPDIWPADFDRMAWYHAETREFLWLTEGQTFRLGEDHFIETIFLPGHTRGSTMFFDWKHHILFAGDNLDYSLWLLFADSAPLYAYRNYLQRLEKYPVAGILPAHRKKLLSPWLLKRMPEAIDHLDIGDSRNFYHPRTGVPALLYKEPLNGESPDGLDTIYIVYQRNNME